MTEKKVTGNSLLFSHLKVVWVCVVDITLKKTERIQFEKNKQ
jgi:hypothetical protein